MVVEPATMAAEPATIDADSAPMDGSTSPIGLPAGPNRPVFSSLWYHQSPPDS
jgi:hypothetical protein